MFGAQPRGSLTLAMGLWEANEVQLLSLPDASLMHTVPLISSHARSIVTGRMGSTDMLFAGCSDGTVVYAPLPSATSAGHESAGDASSPQARRVHAGASGVALHWVPEQQDTAAHVYAQSDKGLVLRVAAGTDSSSAGTGPGQADKSAAPNNKIHLHHLSVAKLVHASSFTGSIQACTTRHWTMQAACCTMSSFCVREKAVHILASLASAAGPATSHHRHSSQHWAHSSFRHALIWILGADVELEAVRVHQAEGLVAITPVHTEEMPAAMAWLSQDHMLTFGHMDHSKHLHWQTHSELPICPSLDIQFGWMLPKCQHPPLMPSQIGPMQETGHI